MREIQTREITKNIKEMCIEANYYQKIWTKL